MPAKPSSQPRRRRAPPAPAGPPGRPRRARRRPPGGPDPTGRTTRARSPVALDGHREAGEVVGLAQRDPRLGQVDHDQHAPATLPRRRSRRPGACLSVECRPVPDISQRDPDEVAAILTRWLATKSADGPGPRSSTSRRPPPTGSPTRRSCAAPARADGEERRLVVRVAPTKHLLFMDAEFSTQYRVMRALADGGSAVPLPRARLVRGGPAVLRRALLHHGPRRGPGPVGQHPLHDGGLGHRGHARAAGAHVVERHRRAGRGAPHRLARRRPRLARAMPTRGQPGHRAADVLLPGLPRLGRPRACRCP